MICRYCGKRINSVRFCGICGKQSPIILKWNNYEECSEIREISKYLKNASLPSLEKNKEDKKENLEEIRDIKKIPENIKVKTVIPELNNNIPKINSNKKNPKKTNNISKRKYLILSVFVGIVVVAAGTVAAISLGSHNNDSGKDRNDKSEVDSEDIEESTLVNLENSSDKESTETSESGTQINSESTETSYTETTETNEEARKNKTMTNIGGDYYSVSDVYDIYRNNLLKDKNGILNETFYMFDFNNDADLSISKKNGIFSELKTKRHFCLKNGKLYYNISSEQVDVSNEQVYSNTALDFEDFYKNGSIILDKSFFEIGQDFISCFEYNKFVQSSYEDNSANDKNVYFFKLKNKNTNVTLMCNKLGNNSSSNSSSNPSSNLSNNPSNNSSSNSSSNSSNNSSSNSSDNSSSNSSDNSVNNLKFDDRNDTEEITDNYEATTSETSTVKTTTKNKSDWFLGISGKDKETESQDTSEETTEKNESEETTKKNKSEETTEKFIFDIVDGEGNHLECDKEMDNNFEIYPYYGSKGDPKGNGEVLRDHYIGKYMIARLEIGGKNWFILRDYNDKSSVYVVQYIKYNDEKNNN